ncbi:entericidin A/B family lipoprotein [Niveispirillum irakense]|nr:entericidin A/B family lipoprotein [Niveispirillum irakense]
MKHATLIISLILCLFTLSACNTIQGMGRDIEKAGEAIQGSAQKAKS